MQQNKKHLLITSKTLLKTEKHYSVIIKQFPKIICLLIIIFLLTILFMYYILELFQHHWTYPWRLARLHYPLKIDISRVSKMYLGFRHTAGTVVYTINNYSSSPNGLWVNSPWRPKAKWAIASELEILEILELEMTSGQVHASYSLPEWQAVKLTFFAP